MNQDLYRIIFNRSRGIWMAVQETARACRAGRTAAVTGMALAAPLALAQIIADPAAPGRERPTVLKSANGTPTVQIQTPSPAGVSRNRYRQFDIGQQGERGAILNNSRTPVPTQIGGAVPGNPWLARGSAKVIVNEVQSAAQSRLGGALEVAGQRADVIIANPAGLVVNGLSLINAAGLTLAGGQPLYRADGSLEGFRVERGAIQIEGRGLDATQTDYAQVLARAIALNAGLWAQDLRVTAGASPTQPAPANGDAPATNDKPQFALDVAQLGGMYARKIMVIGTEAGLGVRNAGMIAAVSDHLTLSADGLLRNTGVITSQGRQADLQLTAKGIDNQGTLSSQRDTVLADESGQTTNAGTIEARRQLLAQAGELTNQDTGKLIAERLDITAARIDNAGHIVQTGPQALTIGSLSIANTGAKAVLGTPLPAPSLPAPTQGASAPAPAPSPAPAAGAGTSPAAPGPTPDPAAAPGSAPLPRGNLHAAQRLENTGQLVANGATDVKAIHSFVNAGAANLHSLHSERRLDNSKGTLQLQQLTGAQDALLNAAGSLVVTSDLRLVADQIDNTGGFIGTPQSLSIRAQTLANDGGTLSAGKDLTVEAQKLENHRKARLMSAGGSVRLTLSQALNNQQGLVSAHQGLHIDSATVSNPGGTLRTTGVQSPLDITSGGGGIDNSAKGLIHSSGDLKLSPGAAPVNNTTGVIVAQRDLRIESSGPVDNRQGQLQAGQALIVRDSGVAAGAGLDKATQTLSNQDGMLFGNTLEIRNRGLTGAGRLDALGDMTLDQASDLTHPGTMAADGKLLVKTTGRLVNQGQLLGGAGVELTGTQIENQSGAQISARHNTTAVTATQTLTNRGLIDGAHTRIDADSVDNMDRIYGNHVSIAAKALKNRAGDGASKAAVIAARQDLDLGVPRVTNEIGAEITSLGDMRMGQSLDVNRQAIGQGQELNNNGARLDAQGNMKLDFRVVNNLNAGLSTTPMADVEKRLPGDLISLPGQAPESATLYREAGPDQFVPYFEHKGVAYWEMGIWGNLSDGRMFKPAHVEKFLHIPPAAFIDPMTSLRNGAEFPPDTPLQLEPADSPRFAQFGVAVPDNYTTTAPDPLAYGAVKEDSGKPAWKTLAGLRTYEAAVKVYEESIAVAQKLHYAILTQVQEDNRILDSSREYTKITNTKQTIHKDKLTDTKYARIEAGGNIDFPGQVNNIDSTISAGQKIIIRNPNDTNDPNIPKNPKNQGTRGNQSIFTEGDGIRYKWEHRGGFRNKQERQPPQFAPYTHTKVDTFELPTLVFKEHQPPPQATAPDANPNTGHPAQRPTPVVREHGTEAGQVARTLEAGTALPQSSRYVVNLADAHQPLVQADPAFTRGGQWTSSDQLLDALDPTRLQKRLGDGYYEQQLIQQQVGQLTGRRFLGDYRSNDAQYQALLQSGKTFAKAHGLRPGVALSAAQMAQLTSDLVWLVEQKVTLPDGAEQTVLVPRLYVVAKPGDLQAHGGLLSADQVIVDTGQDAANSATIAGRRLVHIVAHDINNVAGNITGKVVGLYAKRDMNVAGGTLSATEALLMHADRDIKGASTTQSTSGGQNLDQVAALVLRPDPDADTAPSQPDAQQGTASAPRPAGLRLSAGRDIGLQAVQISNRVEGSETSIFATRDIDLSTVTTSETVSASWNPTNHLVVRGGQEIGTQIFTRGPTQIVAHGNMDARAAQVQSTGPLAVNAGASARIGAGLTTESLDDAYSTRRSGLLNSSSHSVAHQIANTGTVPSNFAGSTVNITAGQDIDVIASNVFSARGTWLNAQGDVNIVDASETSGWQRQQRSGRSGLFAGDGLGVTLGSQRQSTAQSVVRMASAPSNVGSMQGDVDIQSGKAYRQIGSNVFSTEGNLKVNAKSIAIIGTPENEHGSTRSSFRQSGLGLSLISPAIGIVQTASSLADAASQTSDGRMRYLAGGAAALNVYNQRKALDGDLNPRFDFIAGSRQSRSQSAYSSTTMRPSRVFAGGKVTLTATGAGEESNIVIQDSQVHGNQATQLTAEHKIRLLVTPGTRSESSRHSSRSASLGLSWGAGGPGIGASASRGQGHTQSDEKFHPLAMVTSDERVEMVSGGNTEIIGARVQSPRIAGSVGGKLIIESLQDTSRFDGKQSHVSGSLALGAGSAAASGGYSQSRAKGDFVSVDQRAGLVAGDGGYNLEVKDQTILKGGAITSSQAAIDNQRNRLSTRTLVPIDIENRSDYTASGFDISGGIGTGGDQQAWSSGSDTVTDPGAWSAQNLGRPGVNSAGMGYSSSQGSERSITRRHQPRRSSSRTTPLSKPKQDKPLPKPWQV